MVDPPASLPTLWHPELVRHAAREYLVDLNQTLAANPNAGVEVQTAIRALVVSIQAALAWGPGTRPRDMPFSSALMAAVPAADQALVVSETQLGWGRDRARVIAIGTESNGPLKPPGLQALTIDCASHLIWLTASRSDLMAQLGSAPSWAALFRPPRGRGARDPYHIFVAKYHAAARNSTWQRLGKDVLAGGADWQRVLGEQCYQIELKAMPAQHSAQAGPVTTRREAFLATALGELRRTAAVVVFHGKMTFPAARRLAPAFFGLTTLPPKTPISPDERWVREQYDANGRRVLLCLGMAARTTGSQELVLLKDLVQQKLSLASTGQIPDLEDDSALPPEFDHE